MNVFFYADVVAITSTDVIVIFCDFDNTVKIDVVAFTFVVDGVITVALASIGVDDVAVVSSTIFGGVAIASVVVVDDIYVVAQHSPVIVCVVVVAVIVVVVVVVVVVAAVGVHNVAIDDVAAVVVVDVVDIDVVVVVIDVIVVVVIVWVVLIHSCRIPYALIDHCKVCCK